VISLLTCWVLNQSETLESLWTRAGDQKGMSHEKKRDADDRIAYVELDSVELLNKALSVSYVLLE
jgi:hypothetical protein